MDDFPEFMKTAANSISSQSQSKGIEGWVYEGVDGKQMAYWRCRVGGTSNEHVHDYDEYFVVVQGIYTLIIDGQKIPVRAGEEHFIPKGLAHAGEFTAGTRTIHCFGGRRASRAFSAIRGAD
jgi:quercetin dioxygenase-like cupin family protein